MPTNHVPANTGSTAVLHSITSDWTTVGDTDGGLGNMNLGTVQASIDQLSDLTSTQIATQTVNIKHGTFILVRAGYDINFSAISQGPVIVAWGRVGSGSGSTTDVWQVLKTRSGAGSLTIACNPGTSSGSDNKGATYQYTSPDPAIDAFDRAGCDQVLFIVKTAIAGTGGTASTSILQVKSL